ncbi:MAG: type VI secretion system ATPase TssH [Magnetovibrionaceae bacterium]
MGSDIKSLVQRLNGTCRSALEKAAELCVSQTHFNVEVEHLLIRLLETPNTDFDRILRHFDIPVDRLKGQLQAAMDGFKRGNSRTPALSPQVPTLLEESWVIASLRLNEREVRSGVILMALLETDSLRGQVLESAPLLGRIGIGEVRDKFEKLVWGSIEIGIPSVEPDAAKPAVKTKTKPSKSPIKPKPARKLEGEALQSYCIDLTDQARQGGIDPIQGRDSEIRQIIDILLRRRQNNPILTGEAGVGKTAVVEGFAQRVADGDVPEALKEVAVLTLDMGLLQAGAGMRGEFEQRLKNVIDEIKAAPLPIILFIDEAHTLIGAGGAAGQGDAANLLKPELARGGLRTIAATTWAEYKKYFEKDAALARRFQVVKVPEPDEDTATEMLRGLVGKLQDHHGVRILDSALSEAARLSARYIAGRQLPDKAVSVLDTACARVAVAQGAQPAELEGLARSLENIDREIEILQREADAGYDHKERLDDLEERSVRLSDERDRLQSRWQAEKEAVERLLAAEAALEAEPEGEAAKDLAALRLELEVLQGDEPLVPAAVDGRVVAAVISAWTGIPVGKMMADEVRSVLALQQRLAEKVIGQTQALEVIAKRLQTSRAGLQEPGKPVGVFLLAGPSGVGKTETAIAIADLLYGGEDKMVTINMSEYQEAHSVSGLKGAPPGYVGYGTGGVLTEAVRRNPYSVVLLDEIEKAHADVLELFYQVFDKGRLEDGEGTVVDFRNTVILLTTNLGSDRIWEACQGLQRPSADSLSDLIRPDLVRHLKPALLGRMVAVPYFPLDGVELEQIVKLKLAKIASRFEAQHRAAFSFDEALVAAVAAKAGGVDSGARMIDNLLTGSLLPELSLHLLDRMAEGEEITAVHVSVADDGSLDLQIT